MYILLESSNGNISEASVNEIDCMGMVSSEKEAMAWRNSNIDYREYKYAPTKSN